MRGQSGTINRHFSKSTGHQKKDKRAHEDLYFLNILFVDKLYIEKKLVC
jgi:hypothetical protein